MGPGRTMEQLDQELAQGAPLPQSRAPIPGPGQPLGDSGTDEVPLRPEGMPVDEHLMGVLESEGIGYDEAPDVVSEAMISLGIDPNDWETGIDAVRRQGDPIARAAAEYIAMMQGGFGKEGLRPLEDPAMGPGAMPQYMPGK